MKATGSAIESMMPGRGDHKRHLRHAVLGVSDMRVLERRAIDSGVSEVRLMHNAGRTVADKIQKHFDPCPTLVLCGPGHNGGDGYVVAQRLLEKGWLVKVATLDSKAPMPPAAAHHRMYWQGITVGMNPEELNGIELVIDALFGTGLDRPIDGPYLEMITAVNDARLDVISIDIASGVHGDTGAVLGTAISADMTITFGYRKRGQMLMPGRHHQGEIMVADIGLGAVEDATCFVNHPDLWLRHFPFPSYKDHKYTRGHALIFGGDEMTGASRLAAQAARRSGAGLVTLACSEKAYPIYALSLLGTLVAKADTPGAIDELLKEDRINSLLIGCGMKPDGETRTKVLQALKHHKATVVDAGALSAFETDPGAL
ncbi:MAG: NAD(P)H-hydrate epimerase, partial [Holosporales bacterium]